MSTSVTEDSFQLNELGYRIFMDRYALKDHSKKLQIGDTVVIDTNDDVQWKQKEPATVIEIMNGVDSGNDMQEFKVRTIFSDQLFTKKRFELDIPVETELNDTIQRMALAQAKHEQVYGGYVEDWYPEYEWLLSDARFIPGGRVWATLGTKQQLTMFNCFCIPSPKDSREGIRETLGNKQEIMSRGGGVGINLSSLRPRGSYVRGVNGRSSGAVGWGALYSYDTGLIEQGGCFGGDQQIATNLGLIKAVELANRLDKGENILALTHMGAKNITASFRNGIQPLYRVRTSRGFSVDVTETHKIGIIQEGKISTLPLKDLKIGDQILTFLGEEVEREHQILRPVEYNKSIMATNLNENISFPTVLDEKLSYLIGYMHGNGHIYENKAIKISIPDDRPEIKERIISHTKDLFALDVINEVGYGKCSTVAIYSRLIVEWMRQNKILKDKTENICVPELIFQSSSSVVGAFIAGYFDADGCDRNKKAGYGIDSISKKMLQDVQQLLASNGILSHIFEQRKNEMDCNIIYRLSITGSTFKKRMSNLMSISLKDMKLSGERMYGINYPAKVWKALNIPGHYYQGIWNSSSDVISYHALEQILNRLIIDGKTEWANAINSLLHVVPDTIISIEALGDHETYDFEVEDTHMLSGNGVYTSNSRRGALMLILEDWHPDLIEFICSKNKPERIQWLKEKYEAKFPGAIFHHHGIANANISIGISDSFMEAVKEDKDWEFVFPDYESVTKEEYANIWNGDLNAWKAKGYPVKVYASCKARDLWNLITESAYLSAEPGIVFLERYNDLSNSYYYERIIATNPCGEQGLPGWGVCNLGHINLARFVVKHDEPWEYNVDWNKLGQAVRLAVRFQDNIVDITPYFMQENKDTQLAERRIGLGTMGLAEMLIRLKLRYGSNEAIEFIDSLYKFIAHVAYDESINLAKERGAFPKFDADKFLQSKFVKQLVTEYPDLGEHIRQSGIRNVALLTQAPTGSTGTMIGTSTGIEPFYGYKWWRKSRIGTTEESIAIMDEYINAVHEKQPVEINARIEMLPDFFVTAMELTPEEHVQVQAAIQKWTDSSISKTTNMPSTATIEDVANLYMLAYNSGCKGITIYRDGSIDDQILTTKSEMDESSSDIPLQTDPRKRPTRVYGFTDKIPTPMGKLYITVNFNEENDDAEPVEVFIRLGKAGQEINAFTEALGRLISTSLKYGVPYDQVVKQLRDIVGANPWFFKHDLRNKGQLLKSIPDAVGMVLESYTFEELVDKEKAIELPQVISTAKDVSREICPQCGGKLQKTEGCTKCLECSWSKC